MGIKRKLKKAVKKAKRVAFDTGTRLLLPEKVGKVARMAPKAVKEAAVDVVIHSL